MKNKQQTNNHKKMETKDQKNEKLPWEAPQLIIMEVYETEGKAIYAKSETATPSIAVTGPS